MSAHQRLANIVADAILSDEGFSNETPELQADKADRYGELAIEALAKYLNVTPEQIEGLGGPPDARQD